MKNVGDPMSVPSPCSEANVSLTSNVETASIVDAFSRMPAKPPAGPRRVERRPALRVERRTSFRSTLLFDRSDTLRRWINMAAHDAVGIRNVALVGPHHSGKTTLVEALLAGSGAIARKGSVVDHTATTDHDPEAHAHQMSVAPGFATLNAEGARVNLIDCPGAIDFL